MKMTKTMTQLETKKCSCCGKELPFSSFYNSERYLCIPCERELARNRMRRYGRTLRGKASRALQNSRQTIKQNGYDVFDNLTLMDVIFTFAMADECAYCGKSIDGSDYQMDHIVALSKGGPNTLSNITVACPACNNSKHSHELLEWREFDDVAAVIAQVASRRGVSIAEVLEEFEQ